MYRVQAGSEDFATAVQMVEVGPAVMPAGVAPAFLIQRPVIGSVAAVAYTDNTGSHEQVSVAGVAGRQNAVEHIDAKLNSGDDILGLADPHQVARHVDRDVRQDARQYLVALPRRLADRQTAERIAVEAGFQETRRDSSRNAAYMPPWTMPNSAAGLSP